MILKFDDTSSRSFLSYLLNAAPNGEAGCAVLVDKKVQEIFRFFPSRECSGVIQSETKSFFCRRLAKVPLAHPVVCVWREHVPVLCFSILRRLICYAGSTAKASIAPRPLGRGVRGRRPVTNPYPHIIRPQKSRGLTSGSPETRPHRLGVSDCPRALPRHQAMN